MDGMNDMVKVAHGDVVSSAVPPDLLELVLKPIGGSLYVSGDSTLLSKNGEYEKLRKIKLYGRKDHKTEILPMSEIRKEILELGKYLPGESELVAYYTFFARDPLTGQRLLKGDHVNSFLRNISNFSFANNFKVDLSLSSKEGRQQIKIKKRTRKRKEIEKFANCISYPHDSDYCQLFTIKGRVKAPGIDKVVKRDYYSKQIEGFLKSGDYRLEEMAPKPPYMEAYTFSDIFEIAEYYKQASPIILPYTKNKEVSIRCFRSKDGKLKKAPEGMKEAEYKKWVKELQQEGQSESGIRRWMDRRPIEINTSKDLGEVVYKYFGFEVVPVWHPKNLLELSEEKLKNLSFPVVVDFDNRQRDYCVARDYINLVVGKLEDLGIKGSLWLTGTQRYGAHFLFYVKPDPEALISPAKTETYQNWSKKPYARKILDCLKAYSQTLILKIIAMENLECGINPMNENEAMGSKMIAEIKCDYKSGVKVAGSLNPSVKWGVKTLSSTGRMPESQQDYRNLTSRENFLNSLSDIKKRAFKERKYSESNFKNLISYLPPEQCKEIYRAYNYSNGLPLRTVRHSIKKRIE